MYVPKHFEETRVEVLQSLIRDYPLATLITATAKGLEANPVPMQLVQGRLPFGTLRGHVARANPLWQVHDPSVDVLVVFNGPQAYITPSWYATKREHGRVVPTWNYTVVQARGKLRVIEEADWLHELLESLTADQESMRAAPWRVDDAPPDYVERLLGAIVGIEIVITQLCGKWKVSQNQPAMNRSTVIEGLQSTGRDEASAIAALVPTG